MPAPHDRPMDVPIDDARGAVLVRAVRLRDAPNVIGEPSRERIVGRAGDRASRTGPDCRATRADEHADLRSVILPAS